MLPCSTPIFRDTDIKKKKVKYNMFIGKLISGEKRSDWYILFILFSIHCGVYIEIFTTKAVVSKRDAPCQQDKIKRDQQTVREFLTAVYGFMNFTTFKWIYFLFSLHIHSPDAQSSQPYTCRAILHCIIRWPSISRYLESKCDKVADFLEIWHNLTLGGKGQWCISTQNTMRVGVLKHLKRHCV